VSFDFNLFYSSCWGYSLINTIQLKKNEQYKKWMISGVVFHNGRKNPVAGDCKWIGKTKPYRKGFDSEARWAYTSTLVGGMGMCKHGVNKRTCGRGCNTAPRKSQNNRGPQKPRVKPPVMVRCQKCRKWTAVNSNNKGGCAACWGYLNIGKEGPSPPRKR